MWQVCPMCCAINTFCASMVRAHIMVKILPSKPEMAQAAARHAADSLRLLLAAKETVRLLAATGAAQFEFLQALGTEQGIDWARVELFHLDEYVGISAAHPAS